VWDNALMETVDLESSSNSGVEVGDLVDVESSSTSAEEVGDMVSLSMKPEVDKFVAIDTVDLLSPLLSLIKNYFEYNTLFT